MTVSTPVFVLQRALPLLRDGGRIVNVGSAATRIANPLQIGYTVTKAALAALVPSLANDLDRRGITVNTVEPGVVLTDPTAGWTGAPEAMAGLEPITALGRIGEPEDVADVVGFLAGPRARGAAGPLGDRSDPRRLRRHLPRTDHRRVIRGPGRLPGR